MRMCRTIRRASTAGAALAVLFAAMPAVLADRLSDRDVKALIERVDDERDRFEDQLDGELKRKIVRAPGIEVNVERYLDDLQDNVDKLKERFTPAYAASAEVTTVLRQASDIQRFMASQPPNFDGASEWNRLAASLAQLASVYGTAMPLREGQQARRLNDAEVRRAADGVAKSADRFKKDVDAALKNDRTVAKATRDATLSEIEALKEGAKELASIIDDGRPASGEAKALLDQAARIRGASSSRPLSPAAKDVWGDIEGALDKVAQGFEMPAR